MKRLLLLLAFMATVVCAGAQDCEALVAPYFHNDLSRRMNYPADKFEWRCLYAQYAFYESDTVVANADVLDITAVQDPSTRTALPSDFVVDLTTLSIYSYNFLQLQREHRGNDYPVCFSTPSSTHPYLVMRPQWEVTKLAEREFNNRR